MVGWQKGLLVIDLVRLLTSTGAYNLAEAKSLVDSLLDGGVIEVTLPPGVLVPDFVEKAEALGAVVDLAQDQ